MESSVSILLNSKMYFNAQLNFSFLTILGMNLSNQSTALYGVNMMLNSERICRNSRSQISG